MAVNTVKLQSGLTLLPITPPLINGQNGDVYYDTTANKIKAQENGVLFNVINQAFLYKTANYTAVAFDKLAVDTTSGGINVTLPASPNVGDNVIIADGGGVFATNNCTVLHNGNNIVGLAQDFVLDVNDILVTFIYVNSTRGWTANR